MGNGCRALSNGVQSETLSGSLLSFDTTPGETIVLVRPGTNPDQYRTSSLDGSGDGSGTHEAENAQLSAGAAVNNNHTGYSGTGFVDGYWNAGATTTFIVNVATVGSYDLTARYANAQNNPSTVSIYVNGTKIKQASFPILANWDTWGDQTEQLNLNAGANTITYMYDTGDIGWINLDKITIGGGVGGIVDGGVYTLIDSNSGKALDVSGPNTADGTNVQIWTPTGGANQHWQIVSP